MKKRIFSCVLAVVVVMTLLPMSVFASYEWKTTKPSGSVVSVYGTTTSYGDEKNAIKSGPLFGSTWYTQVSTKKDTNNKSFTIPPVSELFTLNDGWELAYEDYRYSHPRNDSLGMNFKHQITYWFQENCTGSSIQKPFYEARVSK